MVNTSNYKKICTNQDLEMKFDVTINPHKASTLKISIENPLKHTVLTWGIRDLKIAARLGNSEKKVWYRQYFTSEIFEQSLAPNWKINTTVENPSGKCGEIQMLGGPEKFNGIQAKRIYTALPKHAYVHVSANLYMIDNWEPYADVLYVNLNGKRTNFTRTTGKNGETLKNLCQGEAADEIFHLNLTSRGRKDNLILEIGDNLKRGAKNAYWGVADLIITLMDENKTVVASWNEQNANNSKWTFERCFQDNETYKCKNDQDKYLGGKATLSG
jgi:hypothetical protein